MRGRSLLSPEGLEEFEARHTPRCSGGKVEERCWNLEKKEGDTPYFYI